MSDKFLKVKDNGAEGLALVRAEAEDVAADLGVSDLKEQMNDGGITLPSAGHEIIQGSFKSSGAVDLKANRIRVDGFTEVHEGDVLSFTPGEDTTGILLGYFDTEKTYIRDGSWHDAADVIPIDADGYVIPIFRKGTSGANITPEDYDAVTVIVTKYRTDIDKIESCIFSNDYRKYSTGFEDGDDMDDFGVGNYYSSSSGRSAELDHAPFTENSFRMWGFNGTSAAKHIFQVAVGNLGVSAANASNSCIKIRRKITPTSQDDSPWSDWLQIATDASVNDAIAALQVAEGSAWN